MEIFKYLMILIVAAYCFSCKTNVDKENGWAKLHNDAAEMGKVEWKPMLQYVAELHKKSTYPPEYPFEYEWEDIGPGYLYGRAFGHWDIVNQTIDVMPSHPLHAFHQLLNDLKNQKPSGMVPGSIWMPGGLSNRKNVEWNPDTEGHPPIWILGAEDYIEMVGDSAIKYFYTPLIRQITWFENKRNADGEGFYYNDILLKEWESGMDQGVRFDETGLGAWASIDATSHVYFLYQSAYKWSKKLGFDARPFKKRAEELREFIRNSLWADDDGMFYDIWAMKDKEKRHFVIENFWPMIMGAATNAQANQLIDNYLLNPDHFLTEHMVPSVSINDPKFELRCWRGPSWNSLTYWIARGCFNYGRKDVAKIILEKALTGSAKQFKRTGTIWEFYDPFGGNPENVQRKPETGFNHPCSDYLGHNPLLAMARLYERVLE